MADPRVDDRVVRAELSRLARDEPIPRWRREEIHRRAAASTDDVAAAAAFVESGGRDRLAATLAAARRDGDGECADRARELLGTFDRFAAACDTGGSRNRGSTPLPPRSRNP